MFERTYDIDEIIFEEEQPEQLLFDHRWGSGNKNFPRDQHDASGDLERGAFFREIALLDETPRSATARHWNELPEHSALYRNDLNGLVQRECENQPPKSIARCKSDR